MFSAFDRFFEKIWNRQLGQQTVLKASRERGATSPSLSFEINNCPSILSSISRLSLFLSSMVKSRASNGPLQIGHKRSGMEATLSLSTIFGLSFPFRDFSRLRNATSMGLSGGMLNEKGFSFPIVRVIVYSRDGFCSCSQKQILQHKIKHAISARWLANPNQGHSRFPHDSRSS